MFFRVVNLLHHLIGALAWWYHLGPARGIAAINPNKAGAGFFLLLIPLLVTSAILAIAALFEGLVAERWRTGLRTFAIMLSPYLAGTPLLLLCFVKPSKTDA